MSTNHHLDYRNHSQFLGLSDDYIGRDTSWVWILPIPLDLTTSYMGGTRLGPDAIIAASNQVELYDTEVGFEAAPLYGIHTLPVLHPSLASAEAAANDITAALSALPMASKLMVTLGGEHSIT